MYSPLSQQRGRVEFIGISALFFSLFISWRNITTLEVLIVSWVSMGDFADDQELEQRFFLNSNSVSQPINVTLEIKSNNQTSASLVISSGHELGNQTKQTNKGLPDNVEHHSARSPTNMTTKKMMAMMINQTTTMPNSTFIINTSRIKGNQTVRSKTEKSSDRGDLRNQSRSKTDYQVDPSKVPNTILNNPHSAGSSLNMTTSRKMMIETSTVNSITPLINVSGIHKGDHTFKTGTKKEEPHEAHRQYNRSSVLGTQVNANLSNSTRPPLDQLLDGWNIIGDVQFLLHFAIMGHAKCGTSTLMDWFGHHPRLQIFPYEVQHMSTRKPATLIRKIYTELKAGPHYRYGYKNPTDVEHKHILEYLNKWFPKTGIFIGVRHPVLWFESFYNFRVQNWDSMPNATALIGRCTKEKKMTCTYRANFHHNLFAMRKTTTKNDFLNSLLKPVAKKRLLVDTPVRNPVFLFDTAQLADQNETRKNMFRKHVQAFLGLDKAMPPIPHSKPGKKAHSAAIQKEKDSRKINICRDEYVGLRKALMSSAREASSWIRLYFMEAQDVFISSPQYFKEILMEWMHDPCDARNSHA